MDVVGDAPRGRAAAPAGFMPFDSGSESSACALANAEKAGSQLGHAELRTFRVKLQSLSLD